MLKALVARLKEGCRTAKFPFAPPTLPPDFRGRPVLSPDTTAADVQTMQSVCPVPSALDFQNSTASIDLGRCIFCGRCAAACPAKIKFTSEYRLAAFSRQALIVRSTDPSPYVPPTQTDPAAIALRHSLSMREVSAAGCAACELDANVLNTPAWDFSRFGIRFTASPRHADALYLTGPVSPNMQLALEKTWAAIPEPKFLIAAGACAISGGLYPQGALPATPSLYIPGCPPHPATTLDALLRFTNSLPTP